ncbi:hypothetical protein [Streptomyces sp. NPDC048196]|uniref:hypothetical protein n=1 Tax=Streptomyces sp. NPDC048196 TaxID=3154712 RepID=UPI0033DF9CFA
MNATLAAQQAALDAAAQLARALGHLPSANIDVNHHSPERIEISVHDGLDRFEQWREALGIPTAALNYRTSVTGMHIRSSTTWNGIEIQLTGYAPAINTDRVTH